MSEEAKEVRTIRSRGRFSEGVLREQPGWIKAECIGSDEISIQFDAPDGDLGDRTEEAYELTCFQAERFRDLLDEAIKAARRG